MTTTRVVGRFVLLCGLIPFVTVQADQSGLDGSTFDSRVRVQDDLYRAVNGAWLTKTEIPTDKSNYGSFTVLADLSLERIREIVETAAATGGGPGSDAQKVGDFYKSFMDETVVQELGLLPLKSEVRHIRRLHSKQDVVRYFGRGQPLGVDNPIGLFVDQDDKDSSRYLANLRQSGTTLPDRDYYLEDDEKYEVARTALKKYIARLWRLLGAEPGSTPEDILALEKRLAKVQWERTELRNAEKTYNKFTREELQSLTPGIPWDVFFSAAEVEQVHEVNVNTPSFFEGLEKILAETPVDIWKRYLEFKFVDAYAPFLSSSFVDAHFNLHSKILAGVPEQKTRWKRGIEAVSGKAAGDFGVLGDIVGRLYVEKYFKPDAKARMDQLVRNLLGAYKSSINELAWMTDETKRKAQEKLAKITTKIAYPKKWRDYSKLEMRPRDLFGNIRRSNRTEFDRMISKLGKPVDRDEWGMTPQTVNAYYNPGKNEIVFPAAILQPPFFSMEADDAVNYGGIGAVIGHEISHAFDDQGSKYDGDGNLKNWWTDADRDAFRQLAARLVEQYSEYEPLPNRYVDGQLTLGENIADLSGLSIAHKAYKLSLAGDEPRVLAGWTGDQRFFLGWSQVWRRKYRDAEMMRRLLTDPHAPSWYRANGPVSNIDAFYKAFNVKPEDKLFKPKEERIKIW